MNLGNIMLGTRKACCIINGATPRCATWDALIRIICADRKKPGSRKGRSEGCVDYSIESVEPCKCQTLEWTLFPNMWHEEGD